MHRQLIKVLVTMLLSMWSAGALWSVPQRSLFHRSISQFMSKKVEIRPTIDDVERISKGLAAKRRGTGSRQVPHRLNALERKEWELAKKRRFLMLRGTGWRKERGDSPLANIYRNYCDAVAIPCISIVRSLGVGDLVDQVIVDFSPLRTTQVQQIASDCINIAQQLPSFKAHNDFSNVEKEWGDVTQTLEEEVIWKLPVFSVVASFGVRADARRYAKILALKYADGIDTAASDEHVEDDLSNDN